MIKIIFVLDKLPFKPSNGVTIASNSLIRASFSICDEIDVFIIGENKIYKDIREDFSYGFSELNHNVNYSEYCTVFVSPISPTICKYQGLFHLQELFHFFHLVWLFQILI